MEPEAVRAHPRVFAVKTLQPVAGGGVEEAGVGVVGQQEALVAVAEGGFGGDAGDDGGAAGGGEMGVSRRG